MNNLKITWVCHCPWCANEFDLTVTADAKTYHSSSDDGSINEYVENLESIKAGGTD